MLVVMRVVAIAIVAALLGEVIAAAWMGGGGDIGRRAFLLVMVIPVGIGLRLWWSDIARDVRGGSGSATCSGPDVERAVTGDDHRRSLYLTLPIHL